MTGNACSTIPYGMQLFRLLTVIHVLWYYTASQLLGKHWTGLFSHKTQVVKNVNSDRFVVVNIKDVKVVTSDKPRDVDLTTQNWYHKVSCSAVNVVIMTSLTVKKLLKKGTVLVTTH